MEVVRAQQSALLGFLLGDAGDDGGEDMDDEGRLTEYFTSLFINASPHPIQDLMGNALYNSESDLVSRVRYGADGAPEKHGPLALFPAPPHSTA